MLIILRYIKRVKCLLYMEQTIQTNTIRVMRAYKPLFRLIQTGRQTFPFRQKGYRPFKCRTTARTYPFHTSFFLRYCLSFRTVFLIPRAKTAFNEWQVFWLTPILKPSRSIEPVAIVLFQDVLRSFTAAGLSGIHTRFPFNPHTRMVYAEPIRWQR